jgi:hypothetical protein
MIQGVIPALILVIVFLVTAGEPDPEWGKFWRLRPILVLTFAGAMGGVCYYILDYLRYRGGWRMIVAYILSFIVYLFGIWIGFVLGFVGTYWH